MDPYSTLEYDLEPSTTGRLFEVYGYNSWFGKTGRTSLLNILKAIYMSNKSTSKVLVIRFTREEINNGDFNILPLMNYLKY